MDENGKYLSIFLYENDRVFFTFCKNLVELNSASIIQVQMFHALIASFETLPFYYKIWIFERKRVKARVS